MSWKTNPIMEWWDGFSWVKISDHNRSSLSIDIERIENKKRMADGTLRRYVVSKKRSFSCSWDNLPSKKVQLLANGEAGEWMEEFHNTHDGAFMIRLREGSDINSEIGIEEVEVMISDFSKEVLKRGPNTDLWSLSITLEEV